MTQLCNDNRLYSNKEHTTLEQCSSAHATELICA